MKSITVHFENGDTLRTSINGTDEEIRDYYEGNVFNLGLEEDDLLTRCISVTIHDSHE